MLKRMLLFGVNNIKESSLHWTLFFIDSKVDWYSLEKHTKKSNIREYVEMVF